MGHVLACLAFILAAGAGLAIIGRNPEPSIALSALATTIGLALIFWPLIRRRSIRATRS